MTVVGVNCLAREDLVTGAQNLYLHRLSRIVDADLTEDKACDK